MATSKTQKSCPPVGTKHIQSAPYKDRDLTKVNPLKEQFTPTEANAVRQHKIMAGNS